MAVEKRIEFVATHEEFEVIKLAAKHAGLSRGAWIRSLCLKQARKEAREVGQ